MYPHLDGLRKPTYIFLSAFLGMLLFLILHRIVIFFILAGIYFSSSQGMIGLNYFHFLAWDYLTLIVILLFGAWYGIWVGTYWYDKVYESRIQGGFISHLAASRYQVVQREKLNDKLSELSQDVKEEIRELKQLNKKIIKTAQSPQAIKRRVVRKRSIKKVL